MSLLLSALISGLNLQHVKARGSCTRSREAIALLFSSASYEGEWCVAQPVTVVHKKHFLGSQIGLTESKRWPRLAFTPVSTNVMSKRLNTYLQSGYRHGALLHR